MTKKGWRYMIVEMESPLRCTICKGAIPNGELCGDMAYFPADVSDKEYAMLREFWQVDPYSDLIVCGMCEWEGKPWSPPPQNQNGGNCQQQ